MRHYDVQAHRRRRAARRQDRRDEDGRRQDARRHAARLPERSGGQGRSRRHGQRLPRAPRLGVDGAASTASSACRSGSSSTSSTTSNAQVAYAADITYGTNNEFGFDYLRDNMKFELESMVQRGHHYAIVDEVDSILIDEARTPLIISGPGGGVDRSLLRSRQVSLPSSKRARSTRARSRPRIAIVSRRRATTSSTKNTRRSRSPKPASRTPSNSWPIASSRAASTIPANMPLLHHLNQAATRARALSARRRVTWSRRGKSSSSTSSPAG